MSLSRLHPQPLSQPTLLRLLSQPSLQSQPLRQLLQLQPQPLRQLLQLQQQRSLPRQVRCLVVCLCGRLKLR